MAGRGYRSVEVALWGAGSTPGPVFVVKGRETLGERRGSWRRSTCDKAVCTPATRSLVRRTAGIVTLGVPFLLFGLFMTVGQVVGLLF